MTHEFGLFLIRYLHVISGVMWIGLLWYFNFVQIPSMGKIPDEQKPAISKVIAPEALFWFRWGAAFTVLFGVFHTPIQPIFTLNRPNARLWSIWWTVSF